MACIFGKLKDEKQHELENYLDNIVPVIIASEDEIKKTHPGFAYELW